METMACRVKSSSPATGKIAVEDEQSPVQRRSPLPRANLCLPKSQAEHEDEDEHKDEDEE